MTSLDRQAAVMVSLTFTARRRARVHQVPRVWRRIPWLAAPAILVVTGSMVIAVVQVLRLSLTDTSFLGTGGGHFIGLDNFINLSRDETFRHAVQRAVEFTSASVIGQLIVATVLALLTWRDSRGYAFSRALIGIPWAVAPIVVAILWRFLYQPNTGPLGNLFSRLGLSEGVLAAPRWALAALCLANIWEYTPLYFLFISSGLRGLNPAVLEAGRVDGATEWQIVRHIVLPQLRPLMVSLAVFNVLSTLGLFDLIWVMTQGGPNKATETASLFIYKGAFQDYVLGSSAAAVVIMTIVAFLLAGLVSLANGRKTR